MRGWQNPSLRQRSKAMSTTSSSTRRVLWRDSASRGQNYSDPAFEVDQLNPTNGLSGNGRELAAKGVGMSLAKPCAAEFFGTFWLVFGGCGSAIFAAGFPQLGIGFIGVVFAFGLTVVT